MQPRSPLEWYRFIALLQFGVAAFILIMGIEAAVYGVYLLAICAGAASILGVWTGRRMLRRSREPRP